MAEIKNYTLNFSYGRSLRDLNFAEIECGRLNAGSRRRG
jgi:hypothetical protein